MNINTIKKYLFHPKNVLMYLLRSGLFNGMSDENYLKIYYKLKFNKKLNLDNPQTFNEKVQWLKINDRNPYYTNFADKYEVKKIIEEKIGKKYVVPTIGVWDKFDDIDFDKLPNKFVIKCTHDSGSIIICKNKEEFDINSARKYINKCLKKNYYYHGREWVYKDVKPRIIIEDYLETSDGNLNDYKFFVFSGNVYCIQVDYDRFTDHHRNFYDTNWNYLPFTTCYPTNEKKYIEKPKKLDEVIDIVKKISKLMNDPKLLRIDFYITDTFIYFGEVTFYHGNRIRAIYARRMGQKIRGKDYITIL